MDANELASSLRLAVSALHKSLRRQASSIDAYSMTEIETISHLFRNTSLLPTELAALTKITTQSMSQILKKLEEHGVVSRTASEEDKRKVFISLTATGKKLVEKVRYERDEWLKGMLENALNDKERALLAKVLPVLNKLTETK